MTFQEAADILRANVPEDDFNLAQAMKMGADALMQDLYAWVDGDLKDWLAYDFGAMYP